MLSLINSAVLLALLGGLGGAGYLAKTGRLETALLSFGGSHSTVGSSSAQAFFALVCAVGYPAHLWECTCQCMRISTDSFVAAASIQHRACDSMCDMAAPTMTSCRPA